MMVPLVILIVVIAGFAQGLTGFGFGLIAMPLLLLMMDLKTAAGLTVILNVAACLLTFASTSKHYTFGQGMGLTIGACVGVPVGIFALVRLDSILLLRLLGAVMILFSANELLLAGSQRSFRLSPRLGFPLGLVSGGLTGAFGMGGPPVVAYTYSQPWGKEEIVAVLQVVFLLSTLLRMILLGTAGLLAGPVLRAGAWSLLPMLLAIVVGQKFFARISQPRLKRLTFIFLGLMGIKYLLFP